MEGLKESDLPADPEDGYGWEKLFSERMCRHFYEDYGLETRVVRYHNILVLLVPMMVVEKRLRQQCVEK